MSTHCLHCGKTFGLMRRGLDLKLGPFSIRVWDSNFCNDTCESLYAAERAEDTRVLDLRRWLYSRPP